MKRNKHYIDVDDDPLIIDGTEYRGDYYEKTNRRVGTQQQVANWWAEGKIPEKEVDIALSSRRERMETKTNLTSGSRNFEGRHKPDGSGKLVHYSTIEAIRTKNLHTISNTQCFATGWAHCSTPSLGREPNGRYSLPLSDWGAIDHSFYDIVQVDGIDDWDGYDKIVEVWIPDEGSVYYRASSDRLDSDALTTDQLQEAEKLRGGAGN